MSDSPKHLLAQYDDVERVVEDYDKFLFKLLRRPLNPLRFPFFMLNFAVGKWKKPGLLLTEKEPPRHIPLGVAAVLRLCTPEERKSEFFKIVLSRHVLHDLSEYVEQKHPDLDFARLAAVGSLRSKSIPDVSLWQIIAAIVGTGTVLLQTVPEAVVMQFTANYVQYRITVFWGMVVALSYATLIIAPLLVTDLKRRRRVRMSGELLAYLRLKHEQSATYQAVGTATTGEDSPSHS